MHAHPIPIVTWLGNSWLLICKSFLYCSLPPSTVVHTADWYSVTDQSLSRWDLETAQGGVGKRTESKSWLCLCHLGQIPLHLLRRLWNERFIPAQWFPNPPVCQNHLKGLVDNPIPSFHSSVPRGWDLDSVCVNVCKDVWWGQSGNRVTRIPSTLTFHYCGFIIHPVEYGKAVKSQMREQLTSLGRRGSQEETLSKK